MAEVFDFGRIYGLYTPRIWPRQKLFQWTLLVFYLAQAKETNTLLFVKTYAPNLLSPGWSYIYNNEMKAETERTVFSQSPVGQGIHYYLKCMLGGTVSNVFV